MDVLCEFVQMGAVAAHKAWTYPFPNEIDLMLIRLKA